MQDLRVCLRQAACGQQSAPKAVYCRHCISSGCPLRGLSAAVVRWLQLISESSHCIISSLSYAMLACHCCFANAGCVKRKRTIQSRRMLQHSLLCASSCIDYSMETASSASSPDCRARFLQGHGLAPQQQRQYDGACLVQKTPASPNAKQMTGSSAKDGDLPYQHKVSNAWAAAEMRWQASLGCASCTR
jgi:hypothetical protein